MWGCATTAGLSADTPAATKEAAVAVRAQARWDAVIKTDYPAAYAYLSPGSKESLPQAAYEAKMAAIKIAYRAAKIDKVTCEAEVCKVMLTLTYDYQKFKGVATPLNEIWIIEKGNGWFVYKE